jgi:hypothetical protein
VARLVCDIARDIQTNWVKPYFGAVPYISAMRQIGSLDEKYGADDAESIVLYFLSNASTWRGDAAKRIKIELKAMLKSR